MPADQLDELLATVPPAKPRDPLDDVLDSVPAARPSGPIDIFKENPARIQSSLALPPEDFSRALATRKLPSLPNSKPASTPGSIDITGDVTRYASRPTPKPAGVQDLVLGARGGLANTTRALSGMVHPGGGDPSANAMADQIAPSPDEMSGRSGGWNKGLQMVGGAIGELPGMTAATVAGGPVLGLGAYEAFKNASSPDSTPLSAMEAGAQGAATGAVLHGAGARSLPVRAAAGAATMATPAYLEGQPLDEVGRQALMGAGMGAIGKRTPGETSARPTPGFMDLRTDADRGFSTWIGPEHNNPQPAPPPPLQVEPVPGVMYPWPLPKRALAEKAAEIQASQGAQAAVDNTAQLVKQFGEPTVGDVDPNAPTPAYPWPVPPRVKAAGEVEANTQKVVDQFGRPTSGDPGVEGPAYPWPIPPRAPAEVTTEGITRKFGPPSPGEPVEGGYSPALPPRAETVSDRAIRQWVGKPKEEEVPPPTPVGPREPTMEDEQVLQSRPQVEEQAPPVPPAPPAPPQEAPPAPAPAPDAPGTVHKLSNTQVNLPQEISKTLNDFGAAIPEDKLAADGREPESHITVKYGIHSPDPSEVQAALQGESPVTVKFGKTSLFQNPDADVLKVDIESPDLHRLNKKIAEGTAHTDTHPDYIPHATIAYLKPGEGKAYAGKEIPGLTGKEVTLDSLKFSGKNGDVAEIPLGKTSSFPVVRNPGEMGMATTDLLTGKGLISGLAELAQKAGHTTVGEYVQDVARALRPHAFMKPGDVDAMYEAKGESAYKQQQIDAVTQTFRSTISKLPTMDQVRFIDTLRQGKAQPTPELQHIAQFIQQVDDGLFEDAKKFAPWMQYMKNHGLTVNWEVAPKHPDFDPKSGRWAANSFSETGPKSAQGSARFLKDRFWDNIEAGIKHGGKLKSSNPIDILSENANQIYKFVSAQRVFNDWKNSGSAVWVETKNAKGQRTGNVPPEGMERARGDVWETYFDDGGKHSYKNGYWALSKGNATMMEHFLARNPLLEGSGVMAKTGRGLMTLKNNYTSLELGLSGFHPMLVSGEAISSQMGLAFRKILQKPIDPIGAFTDALTAAVAPVTVSRAGSQAKKFFIALANTRSAEDLKSDPTWGKYMKDHPDAEQVIQKYYDGGGQLGLHKDYKNRALQQFTDALQQFAPGNRVDPTKTIVKTALPAAFQAMAKPIFDLYIPNLKLGMFMKEYTRGVQENQPLIDAGKMTESEIARKTVSSLDQRFGEMNWDNLFLDPAFKTSLQTVFRAPLWAGGSMGMVGGAFPEQASHIARAIRSLPSRESSGPWLSPKMAWLMGSITTGTITGGAIMYFAAGKAPQDFFDVMYPQIDPSNPDERIVNPIFGNIKVVQHLLQDPAKYFSSGSAGMWGKALDLLKNKDYFNNQIYNPDDSIVDKTIDMAKHAAPVPISIQSYMRGTAGGQSLPERLAPTLGFPKAPRYAYEDAATQKLREIQAEEQPRAKTKLEAERRQTLNGIANAYRGGRMDQAKSMIEEGLKAGIITDDHVEKALAKVAEVADLPTDDRKLKYLAEGVNRLPMHAALDVWDKATPAQRRILNQVLIEKMDRDSVTLSPAELQSIGKKAAKVGWDPQKDY